jgi:RND family efflux transporter MFP subunit
VGRVVLAFVAIVVATAIAARQFRPVPVTTTPVVRGTALEAVYATGTVEPFDRVIVKAKATGAVDLKVREGATVKKGDLIATIDSATLRYDLERGRADLWAASQQATSDGPQLAALEAQARSMQAEMNTIESDRARTARLVSSGAAPQAELDRLIDRAASLQAQLDANAAQRRALRIDLTARAKGSSAAVDSLAAKLADAEVRAPMDGVVLDRFVEPGEVAQINSPLVKIGTAANLILECAVDEADIGKVKVGKRVAISLYAFPQTVAKGEVFEILPDADRVKKTFLAKVRFVDPPADLRSGMTAEANVIIEEHDGALLAPVESVDPAGAVFVVADGRAQRLTPRLGVRDMLRVEVLDGLREGDQVVVSGGGALEEGRRVRGTVKPPFDGVIPSGVIRSKMSL